METFGGETSKKGTTWKVGRPFHFYLEQMVWDEMNGETI
jgi:hypothetical protein